MGMGVLVGVPVVGDGVGVVVWQSDWYLKASELPYGSRSLERKPTAHRSPGADTVMP